MITRRSFLAGTSSLAAATAVAGPVSAALSLELATVWPQTNFHTRNAVAFAEAVGRVTGGAVTITVRAGGDSGFKGPETLRAVREGRVDMADVLTHQQVAEEPLLGTEAIPFLVGSADELRLLHEYLRPAFDEIAASNNQKILYMVPWPTQYFHLKVATDTVDGLSGITIRVPDRNAQEMCSALGMAPVLLTWDEVVPALAAGRVDGVSTSATSAVDGRFWEFLETIYPTEHNWASQMVTINLDRWNEIAPRHRDAIEARAAEMEPGFWDVSLRNDEESLATLTGHGMTVVRVPPEMMTEMRRQTAHLRGAFIARVPQAGPIVAAYLEELGRG